MNDTATMNPWVEKVMKLLSQAENTTHEAEANTFMAKAQALIVKHQISEAELALARPVEERWVISDRYLNIDGSYAIQRMDLLNVVCLNNDVKLVNCGKRWDENGEKKVRRVRMIGTEDDMLASELLWSSLCLQATRDMLNAPAVGHAKSFRVNFWNGFMEQVGHRLSLAKVQAQEAARQTTGDATGADRENVKLSDSVALALVDKKEARDAYVAEKLGKLRSGKARSYSYNGVGYSAGSASGRAADLGGRSIGSA